MPRMMPVTVALVSINVGVFILQYLIGDSLLLTFALWPRADAMTPDEPSLQVWQLVTYSFLHAGTPHLLFNMFALLMFGSSIEELFGARRYVLYYIVCVIGAAITQLIVNDFLNSPYPTVGASGGIFGLLLAYGMAYPHRRLIVLPIPVPMPAWLVMTLYGAIELFLGITGTLQGVAHFAHLGGMAAGYLLLRYWKGRANGAQAA